MRRMLTMSLILLILINAFGIPSALAQSASVTGTVVDPLGANVPMATVALIRDGERVTETTTGPEGNFTFLGVESGRYQAQAAAAGFEAVLSDTIFVGASGQANLQLALRIGPLEQEMVVTAAASEVPVAQIGAPVTVIDAATLEQLGKTEIFEAIRTVPGVQIQQTGQRGQTASLFVRGGESSFNKVLIDGIPANDIGGAFDISELQTTGVESVEVLRSSNSVLYGTDAMTGVVSVTTKRGRTRIPEVSYSIDGGNLDTFRQAASLGGAMNRFDYFVDVSRFDTDNDLPNNTYHNGSLAGRFGVALGGTTDLSLTVRRIGTALGLPNAFNYYGIPDDSNQRNTLNFGGVTANSRWTDRLQTIARVAFTERHYRYRDPAPTGEPFDPFDSGFPNYIGDLVTIRGANGTSATGRAILNYSGTFPSSFDSSTRRWAVLGQTDYRIGSAVDVSGGFRYENEFGFSQSGSSPRSLTRRDNFGYFAESRGRVAQRFYITGGLGFEHNEVFEFAVSPRVSMAMYVRNPSSTSNVGDTKLTFNFGRGIKAPNLFQELSALHRLVPTVDAIGPERTRSIDAGIEQGFWQGRARLRAAYYHNEFTDLIEFVSNRVLPQLGVPTDVANATGFGANVNAKSYRARGLETSGDVLLWNQLRLGGSYLFLDAVTTKSFTGGALSPATNPAYPGIQIGVFSPLVGNRPFRRPAHSGNMFVSFVRGRGHISLAGYFSGRADDSTFLSDQFFGNSLVLPNQNLANSYQKLDLSGSYRFHRRLRWYASIENLLDQKYEAGSGFPALPFSIRSGFTVTIGGDGN
jgi:iron complex outermembrane receptor protein/vitamin B12 transporter